MNITNRLAALRELMVTTKVDAYFISNSDSHGTARIADYWRSLEWITGFTGSSGLAIITADKAALWTDGRYLIQAKQDLDGTGIEVLDIWEQGGRSHHIFLAENLPHGGKLGFDGHVIPAMRLDRFKTELKDKGITFSYDIDLIGELWRDRPALPSIRAFEHEICFAGMPASEKLAAVRAKMAEKKYAAYLITALDDIAWLLNIRGKDIPYLPVVYAYALITATDAHVFIEPNKAANVSGMLVSQGFELHNYNYLSHYLCKLDTGKLYYNPAITNIHISEAIPANIETESDQTGGIIPLIKAVKTETEQSNIVNAFRKDGIVFVKTLIWLDDMLKKDTPELQIRECDIAHTLENYRTMQPNYICESFPTISAYAENAAIAHYRPGPESTRLQREGLLLIDTGGQYLDGTTDTTRTVALGPITDEMKRNFTLVLKGHIALASAVFLSGTTGSGLDILARQNLWKSGQNFSHGTGHGLGYCLSVHEGPHFIAPYHTPIALTPGMLVSNEPGLYIEGSYGIRIENILLVVEEHKNDSGTYLSFKNLTHCPIDLNVIDIDMLTETEREWLNNYHHCTYETLSPYLSVSENAWLKNATRPI